MDTQRLAQLIDAKLAIATKLLELAERQLAVINENDLSSLLRLLAGKQQLVDQLAMLDQALAPLARQEPGDRRWASPQAHARCRQQQLRCEATLRELLAVEQEAESRMLEQRTATAQRLTTMQHAGQAQQAYAAGPAVQLATLDLTSES